MKDNLRYYIDNLDNLLWLIVLCGLFAGLVCFVFAEVTR